jgi:copper(I)-binding protein
MTLPFHHRLWGQTVCLLALSLGAALCWAGTPTPADGVSVSGAWVRPAVKGQSGTGGYLTLHTRDAVVLMGLKSSVAGEAELHEMRMSGDVMEMRPVPSLALKAGEVLKLAPGGQHLMLMGLKRPLLAGETVPLTLKFKTPQGQRFEVQVNATVQVKAPEPAASGGH